MTTAAANESVTVVHLGGKAWTGFSAYEQMDGLDMVTGIGWEREAEFTTLTDLVDDDYAHRLFALHPELENEVKESS